MSASKRLLVVPVALLAALAAVGCSDDDNPTAPVSQARVMVVHASPDAPAVDLLVDGAVVRSGLAFPSATPYLAVPSGTRNVKVNVAATTTTVIDANLDLARGASYTVFAVDSVASLGTVVLSDDLATPAAGKAHVRFVHLSPNAPAVDVAVRGGPVVFANRAFEQSTAFTPVDAGTYDLDVRLAGTSDVVLGLDDVTLAAGRIYTVFAKGFVGGAGAQALGAQILTNN